VFLCFVPNRTRKKGNWQRRLLGLHLNADILRQNWRGPNNPVQQEEKQGNHGGVPSLTLAMALLFSGSEILVSRPRSSCISCHCKIVIGDFHDQGDAKWIVIN
jgi:hypothetical protein